LRQRISNIAATLGVGPTFVPSLQSDVDRIHAFRLLAHSEIQHFLDSLAERILDKTADRSSLDGVLTHAGHHLLVYYALEPLGSARNAAGGSYPDFVPADAITTHAATDQLRRAIGRHRKAVESNNGVKPGNVRRILTPLGYRETSYAVGLLDQLDALGRERGNVAHGSGVVFTTSWPSGSDEWTRLGIIMGGLDLLERYAPRLLLQAD
jgi:hypothetical protein